MRTNQVIITNERIDHIKEHHPNDYELFTQYGADTVANPDMLILDTKNRGTVFAVKKLPQTNLNVVVRLILEEDDPTYKNSIMTFYRLRESNLQKLIEKHKVLYTKE